MSQSNSQGSISLESVIVPSEGPFQEEVIQEAVRESEKVQSYIINMQFAPKEKLLAYKPTKQEPAAPVKDSRQAYVIKHQSSGDPGRKNPICKKTYFDHHRFFKDALKRINGFKKRPIKYDRLECLDQNGAETAENIFYDRLRSVKLKQQLERVKQLPIRKVTSSLLKDTRLLQTILKIGLQQSRELQKNYGYDGEIIPIQKLDAPLLAKEEVVIPNVQVLIKEDRKSVKAKGNCTIRRRSNIRGQFFEGQNDSLKQLFDKLNGKEEERIVKQDIGCKPTRDSSSHSKETNLKHKRHHSSMTYLSFRQNNKSAIRPETQKTVVDSQVAKKTVSISNPALFKDLVSDDTASTIISQKKSSFSRKQGHKSSHVEPVKEVQFSQFQNRNSTLQVHKVSRSIYLQSKPKTNLFRAKTPIIKAPSFSRELA